MTKTTNIAISATSMASAILLASMAGVDINPEAVFKIDQSDRSTANTSVVTNNNDYSTTTVNTLTAPSPQFTFLTTTTTSASSSSGGVSSNSINSVGMSSGTAGASGGGSKAHVLLPPTDPDVPSKEGGKDPLVFGKWHYDENDGAECETKHKFDYDNDGFVENFCYEIVGSMFVIDWNDNGNIDNGAELLNFHRTSLDGYNPVTYMQEYPNVCEQYNCYLWHDSVKNWQVDDYELIPFSFDIDFVRHFPDGKKLVENGRYAYCAGESVNGEKFYCLQPTYWQKGILPE